MAVQVVVAPVPEALPALVVVLASHVDAVLAIQALVSALASSEAFLHLAFLLPMLIHGVESRAPRKGTALSPPHGEKGLVVPHPLIIDALVAVAAALSVDADPTPRPEEDLVETQSTARNLKRRANRMRKLWQKTRASQPDNAELVAQVKLEWNRTQNLYHRHLRKVQRLQDTTSGP